jgi:hypothetical protein
LLPGGDSVNTTIGFRSFQWDADTGMTLNGEQAKIRGFCDHNDFGGVGMAVADRIMLYRAQQLRSVGGNARRMSHNPPQPAMLDLCVSWILHYPPPPLRSHQPPHPPRYILCWTCTVRVFDRTCELEQRR